ncbi:MAG: hypothetical protein ABSB32_18485 [Thermodesulfobacteriota bacterium]|jgi:hypothetical protein
MKRMLIVVVALIAMVAFVGGVMAQDKTTTTTTTTTKAAKSPKAMKFTGMVAGYEAGKMIKVKGAKDKEMSFDIAADAKVKGEVKDGAKVTVTYKKDGDKMMATGIAVAPEKKKKGKKTTTTTTTTTTETTPPEKK